jgi:hypothetical protein
MDVARLVPIARTVCPDCGGPKNRRSRRCRSCHARRALVLARASPAYGFRPGAHPTGRLGELALSLAGTGARIRPFRDRRGAVVVAGDELVIVELDEPNMTDRCAAWLYAVERAWRVRPVVVRTDAELAELAASLTPRRSRAAAEG